MDNIVATNYPPSRKFGFVIATLFLSLFILGLAGELMTRLAWRNPLTMAASQRSSSFRYDTELGWFPVANSTNQFKYVRSITVHHNADGFRDKPHGPKMKKRMAFVGDSFVWGCDAEEGERFTDKLAVLLPDWELINLGVNGYGTDQELILLQKWFDHYQPDIVVLVYYDNDFTDNASPVTSEGYYKPYFAVMDGWLVRSGIPVPKSMHYYRLGHPWLFKSRLVQFLTSQFVAWKFPQPRSAVNPTLRLIGEMKTYVEARGAKFILAFASESQSDWKRSFCESLKIDHVFLLEYFFQSEDYLYENGKGHWTPLGHDYVGSMLYQFLVHNKFVAGGLTDQSLAPARFRERRVAEAMTQYQRSLEMHPDDAESHRHFGIALFEGGRPAEAVLQYERALQLDPDDVLAHLDCANALATQECWSEAIKHFECALQLKPNDTIVHHNLGGALIYAAAENNLAHALTKQGRWTEAIQHFERALQRNLNYPAAHNNLGLALAAQGKWDEAIPHYERALELNPNYAEAHYTLGNALATQSKLDEAIQHFERALQIKPDFAQAHFSLGKSRALRGELTEAIQLFQQALDLATTQSNTELAENIRSQIKLYQSALLQPKN